MCTFCLLFSTAKVPQKAFIIDLYYGLFKVQSILYNTKYQNVTNIINGKSLYLGILQLILVYMKQTYIVKFW